MEEKLSKKALKKLARENLMKQITKDTLIREEALDKLTRDKIKEKWYNALVDIKVPEVQDNLRYILHFMEKLIEGDNFRKILFEDERQELEEKVTIQAQSHRSALDVLYDIYQRRVHDLNEAYKQNIFSKKTEAEQEFKAIEERESKTQEDMQTMLFQMTQNREKKEDTMNCDMFFKLDDERSKNAEKYENLRTKLEKKMEGRWGEITATLTNYEATTKLRRKEYLQLKAKDDADSKIIHQQMKKTQKLFEQLDELKNCLDNCYAPQEKITLITDLRKERTKLFDTFKEIKSIVAEEIKDDESNLKNLTTITNQIIMDLQKLCTDAEHILTLFRICLKFETEEEKVTPVTGSFYPPREPQNRKRPIEENNFLMNMQKHMTKDYEVLNMFWKKVARVHFSKLTLMKYIQHLERENDFLKGSLASCLKKVAVKNIKGRTGLGGVSSERSKTSNCRKLFY